MRFALPIMKDVTVATGGGGTVPIFLAWDNVVIERLVVLPITSWAADASNYWTLSLFAYKDGSRVRGIPFSSEKPRESIDTKTLAVGRELVLPQAGWIGERLMKDEHLCLELDETGTAATFSFRTQIDVIPGGRDG